MSVASWPASIPSLPLVGSQTLAGLDAPGIETQFESGNVELRQTTRGRVRRISQKILLTSAQFALFQTFVMVTLARGTQRFTLSLDEFSGPRVQRQCQFVGGAGGISAARRGTAIEVSFQLRVLG